MRLIDADALKEKLLAERDAIPKAVIERYGFGTEAPNHSGNLIRGGIRKALRCIEQTPTIDPASLRPKGEWIYNTDDFTPKKRCTNCGYNKPLVAGEAIKQEPDNFCNNCGADMRAGRVSRPYEEE